MSNPGRILEKHLKVAVCELIIAMSKSGNVSPAWIRAASVELSGSMQEDIDMDRERIRLVFLMFRNKSTESIMRYMYNHFLILIAPTAVKLSTTINQIKGSGLTGITIIGTAISDYRDFFWARLAKLMTVEFRAANAARRAFAGKPFVGFNRNTMDLHGLSHYMNFAWVARRLLIEMGTNLTLANYAGLPDAIPQMDKYIKLIDKYKRHIQSVDNEAIDEEHAMIANDIHANYWKDLTSEIPLDVDQIIQPIGLNEPPPSNFGDDSDNDNDQGGGSEGMDQGDPGGNDSL